MRISRTHNVIATLVILSTNHDGVLSFQHRVTTSQRRTTFGYNRRDFLRIPSSVSRSTRYRSIPNISIGSISSLTSHHQLKAEDTSSSSQESQESHSIPPPIIDNVPFPIPNLTKYSLNALLLISAFGYAIYTILNIDHGMTRGWTQTEILTRIPFDNWRSYEDSLSESPIFTKTSINVIIYLLGDWLSQTLLSSSSPENKNVLDFDAGRTLKNGFIGLCFGPLVHEYYEFSDYILPVEVGVNRLYKILMDQTAYLSIKCTIYIMAVGVLNGDTFEEAKDNAKQKILPVMFTAWKFWPLVHCVTYGLIPARHRILWVNCVDLVWNAILALKASATTTPAADDQVELLEESSESSTSPDKDDVNHQNTNVPTIVLDDNSPDGFKIQNLDIELLHNAILNDDMLINNSRQADARIDVVPTDGANSNAADNHDKPIIYSNNESVGTMYQGSNSTASLVITRPDTAELGP